MAQLVNLEVDQVEEDLKEGSMEDCDRGDQEWECHKAQLLENPVEDLVEEDLTEDPREEGHCGLHDPESVLVLE